MTDQGGTTAYEYTPKGQVKKETKVIDSIQYITHYTYDMNGNMTTMTYPSGRVITYNYSNDRAVSVLNGAANLATNIITRFRWNVATWNGIAEQSATTISIA
jgi:YD repeat-containing protein